MSDPITAAIEASMAEAGLTGDDNAGDTDTSTADETPAQETSADATGDHGSDDGLEASADADEPALEEPAAKAKDELNEPAPKPGKENRIPQTRVEAMITKRLTKAQTDWDAAHAPIKAKADRLDALDQMADNDPDAFVAAMALANPAKWKPVQARLAGAPVSASQTTPAAKAPAAGTGLAGTPRPKPNAKLEDGSMTYDDAGLDTLLQWTTDNAVALAEERITKQFEERFGPIEQDHKAATANRAISARIETQITKARETWGPLFEADYQAKEKGGRSEILDYIAAERAAGRPCSFEEGCMKVLLPKLRADRTKMRGELIKEINARPAAAAPSRSTSKAPTGARSIESIIKESMTEAGLR